MPMPIRNTPSQNLRIAIQLLRVVKTEIIELGGEQMKDVNQDDIAAIKRMMLDAVDAGIKTISERREKKVS
jgi:hypothetical protein